MNDIPLDNVEWDASEKTELVATFETESDADGFKTKINSEDSVVATFPGSTTAITEEYVGVRVDKSTKPETTETITGKFTVSSVADNVATGTLVWDGTPSAGSTLDKYTCENGGTLAQVEGSTWTITGGTTLAAEDEVAVTATYNLATAKTLYIVTMTFPEDLPGLPTALKTRGMVDVGTVSVDDIIKLVGTGETAYSGDEYYVTAVTGSGAVTLTGKDGEVVPDATSLGSKIINLTATTNNILAALNREGFALNTYLGNNVTPITEDADITKYNTTTTIGVQVPYGTATQYSVGDLVVFVEQKTNKTPGDDGKNIFTKNNIY